LENAQYFRDKLAAGKTLLGTCITFFDPAVTEALTRVLDFVWIDTEHNPISVERVQAHLMATKGTQTTPLVRVPANDVRQAVAACRYPPEGIRGFGPRRPSGYGARGGPEFCSLANRTIITIVQIEQAEAFKNIDEILAVPGLTSIVVGPNDLANSLGYTGQPRHPEVLRAIDSIISRARAAKVPMGIAVGDDPELLVEWCDKGVNWIAIAADYGLLMRSATQLTERVRGHLARGK